MKKQPQPSKYFNILAAEDGTEATMFLYGYIGEEWAFTGERWEMTGVTDIEFVKEFNRLSAQYGTIHLRINSYGGEILHGAAIVSAIQNSKAEVHTWCDGMAASMGAGIFLAGKKRHMAKNAMLMLHSALNICWGNAKEMRECADTLDKFSASIIAGMAASTGLSEADIKTKYFDDYADHWLTYADALADGLITEKEEEYEAEAGAMPTNLASMTYGQLVNHFHEQQHPEGRSLLQQLRAAWQNTIAAVTGDKPSPIQSQSETQDMTLKDFTDSLAAGTLKLEDVQAHLATLAPPKAEAAPEESPEKKEMAALKAQVEQLSATIAAWGKTPGAGKSTPPMPGDDLPAADGGNTIEARLKATNEALAKAADANESARFVIAQ